MKKLFSTNILANNYYLHIFFANNYYYYKLSLLNFSLILIDNDYYLLFDLLAHHLSKMKYQIELAIGSTIASVKAIIKDTSATNIKTVIAIAK